MPTTVNGIGTHYYGKKNLSVREGVCRFCRTAGKLESYETRLWFVIVFIPVIPLKRKRILEYCRRCSRHYAVDVEQWETQRQLNVSAAKDRFRESPSPEAALEAHAAMMGYHVYEEAAQFRDEALQKFPSSATLCAGLAWQLDQANFYTQATPLYERALALSPDMPEARVGMAYRRMNEGNHAEARQLLDHLMQPGALRVFPAGPLDRLMTCVQKAGKHEEAIEIARHVLAELPQVAQDRAFRKYVTKSEKALAAPESILPPTRFSARDLIDWHSPRYSKAQRWGAVLALGLVVLLSGLAVQNEYRRLHRRLDVVNGLGKPITVAIDGAPAVTFNGAGNIPVAEGSHHVRITGAINEELDVDLRSGYFERWTYSPRWIINPAGAVAFESSTIHYAANPRPSETRLIVGERFIALPHVDYFFESPPQTLKVDSKQSEVVKEVLQQVLAPPAETFRESLGNGNQAKAFTFAEGALLRKPNDAELTELYSSAAVKLNETNRARNFLKPRIGDRPVCIPWHRAYQMIEESARNGGKLEAEYAAALKKEPTNAALLYLKGRVTVDPKESLNLFQQATRVDPKLPWGWYALAYADAGRGNWNSCLEMLSHIPNAERFNVQTAELLNLSRLGSGKAALVEAECRRKLMSATGFETLPELLHLVDALLIEGKPEEAKKALTTWENRLPPQVRHNPAINSVVHPFVSYYLGDFAAIKKPFLASNVPPSPLVLQALLATGEQDTILKRPGVAKFGDDPEVALDLSIACQLAGNAAEKTWREMAASAFESVAREYQQMAVMLRSNEPPRFEEFEALSLMPSTKCRVATLLAVRFPQKKGPFAQLAKRLNVSRQPPYYLLERALK